MTSMPFYDRSQVALSSLPVLRQELGLYQAPTSTDGAPLWSLHDPCVNRFIQLTWPAFEILSRWHLGNADAVLAAVNQETTLSINEADLVAVISFLERNNLTVATTSADSVRLLAAHAREQRGIFLWLLKNYLFFRTPILRPDAFLKKLGPWVRWAFHPRFFLLLALTAALALMLGSRHWESIMQTFAIYRSTAGFLSLTLALPLAKVVHELGHATAAHHYGCKVPAMGIAFVVMTPMLYTDTNETWKLSDRGQRLVVAAAGVLSEIFLAMLAAVVWFFLPDGHVKAGAFVLATTTLAITLLLNASPFMRFDGYFLVCDLLNMPNLHQRAFAVGLWRLRRLLFGFTEPCPEPLSSTTRRFLILFSFAVWAYRLVLFFGIALLVYHFFFKVLGVILFSVEIIWFIAMPIVREVDVWWRRRGAIHLNWATLRTTLFIGGFLLWIIYPWQGKIQAPAILGAAREQKVVAARGGIVDALLVAAGDKVAAGTELGRLTSPQLEQRLALATAAEAVARWQTERQVFVEHLLSQGQVIQRQWEGSAGALHNVEEERQLLSITAPFTGTVVARNEDVMVHGWVAEKEWLLTVADLGENRVEAYVSEADLRRLSEGESALFIPDALEYGTFRCRITAIDAMNMAFLDEPALASQYGGNVVAHTGTEGTLVPVAPLFRVRLGECSPGRVPPITLRGVAHLDAEPQSPFWNVFQYAMAVLRRESGL